MHRTGTADRQAGHSPTGVHPHSSIWNPFPLSPGGINPYPKISCKPTFSRPSLKDLDLSSERLLLMQTGAAGPPPLTLLFSSVTSTRPREALGKQALHSALPRGAKGMGKGQHYDFYITDTEAGSVAALWGLRLPPSSQLSTYTSRSAPSAQTALLPAHRVPARHSQPGSLARPRGLTLPGCRGAAGSPRLGLFQGGCSSFQLPLLQLRHLPSLPLTPPRPWPPSLSLCSGPHSLQLCV